VQWIKTWILNRLDNLCLNYTANILLALLKVFTIENKSPSIFYIPECITQARSSRGWIYVSSRIDLILNLHSRCFVIGSRRLVVIGFEKASLESKYGMSQQNRWVGKILHVLGGVQGKNDRRTTNICIGMYFFIWFRQRRSIGTQPTNRNTLHKHKKLHRKRTALHPTHYDNPLVLEHITTLLCYVRSQSCNRISFLHWIQHIVRHENLL